MSGAYLLVAEPEAFFPWASQFVKLGWRSDPALMLPEASTRGVTWETMADLWNAWYGVIFEEGLQDG